MAKKKAAKKAKTAKTAGRTKKPVITRVKQTNDFNEILRQMAKDREAREKRYKKELNDVAEELFLLGVKKATVDYNGEGDSGDVEYVSYEKLNEKLKVPDELDRRLKDAVWGVLPSGFENNDGGFGTVFLDTANRKVKIEHHQRVIETEDSEQEFEL